jgi:sialic acid synthase SpsE
MATLDEISHAVSVLRSNSCEDFSLLHCISNYPTKPNDCNLASIAIMRTKFNCPIGWSDHTVSPAVIFRAIHKWNAEIIEFHLDIDGKGPEYEFGHCWLPEQMKRTIDTVKTGLDADGHGEIVPSESELCEREWRADPQDGLRPFRYKRIGYKAVE